MFAILFDKIGYIKGIANIFNESWGNLTLEGIYESQNLSYFEEIDAEFESLKIQTSISYYIGQTKSKSTQEFIADIQQNDTWKININKNVLLNKNIDGKIYNFFYSQEKLICWIKNTNPFTEDYPFNNKSICVIVNGLDDSFGGCNLIFCGPNHNNSFNGETIVWENYDETRILDSVHIISNSKFIIKPLNHYLSFGKVNEISKYFFRNSILVLLASLSSEIYENGNIILRGYRRIQIEIGIDYIGDEISVEYQEQLANAVKWVYQTTERCDLRLKLLLERITLDIDYSLPYIQGLFSIIQETTVQAKERYSFIIYDRKDLYQKELKDLLKDLKSLSDLYSNKLRSLLSNLLRDVLAAFILIGITLFSKVTEINSLFKNKLIDYIFIAFALYFALSAIFQSIVDFYDVRRSRKEFDYWKNVTKEYMSTADFKNHTSNTINKRATGTTIIYVIIVMCYFLIALVCYNFPYIWAKIMD